MTTLPTIYISFSRLQFDGRGMDGYGVEIQTVN